MLRGFDMAGADTELVHLDALLREPALLDKAHLIGFPGGFSYGDDIASGRIFAMRVREKLWPALHRALSRGVPIIGACNGFQVLVQIGLLPGPGAGWASSGSHPPEQTVALTDNTQARFMDRWVGVEVEPKCRCVWTQGLDEGLDAQVRTEAMMLPIAHGEGRLVASPEVLATLESQGHIALRYREDVNGSAARIAGLCDASGLVFGLMPHPERFLEWNRHPAWTRLPSEVRGRVTPGLKFFQNAVAAVR